MATHPHDNSDKTGTGNAPHDDPAVALIRQKLDAIYGAEPNAVEEAKEVLADAHAHSKHQIYMRQLTTSGLSLAEIQTKWHEYYAGLTDKEKHEVWQEFYSEQQPGHYQAAAMAHSQTPAPQADAPPSGAQVSTIADRAVLAGAEASSRSRAHSKASQGVKTVEQVKDQLLGKARSKTRKKLKAKQHFQSILFGVGMGSLVILILLFSFFNERFIAPFITPSRQVSSTPIIDASTASVGSTPEIIIPKINVEIPTVYDVPTIEESAVELGLERGVVHYATTPDPGQKGNVVIFGHSSNNILNPGKYKFAFVLLSHLDNGDIFYLTKDGVRYAYQVYDKEIVSPTDVGVLNPTDKPATATLITCDPPGTSINRLIVIGQQISPDPSGNGASTAVKSTVRPTILASNAPSLWQRVTGLFH